MRRLALVSVLLLSGCLSWRDNLVTVVDTDGSSDHRLFRVGAVTRLMMEPVFWKLEDLHLVDFDRPVTESFRGFLPPEYESVTLRMLRENASGLPDDLLDCYRLSDLGEWTLAQCVGTDPTRTFDTREAFVARLWERHFRMDVDKRVPRTSDAGFALLLMAICDRLQTTPDALCARYLIEPYGLKDTAFDPPVGWLGRLTKPCAGRLPLLLPAGFEVDDRRRDGGVAYYSRGLRTSASDLLRVAYVILPHLKRAQPLLTRDELSDGREVWYLLGRVPGGTAFIGFDPQDKHAVVILKNAADFTAGQGLETLETLAFGGEV